MAHLNSKNQSLKMDNASMALTDISGSVNSQSLERAITILDDSGMGDSEHTTAYGMLQAVRVPLNGFVNSTVDAILGPIIASGTGVTKTMQYGVSSTRFYYGEFNIENVQYSGSVDTLQTWSLNAVAASGLTRTSKTQT